MTARDAARMEAALLAVADAGIDIRHALFDRFLAAFPHRRAAFLNLDAAGRSGAGTFSSTTLPERPPRMSCSAPATCCNWLDSATLCRALPEEGVIFFIEFGRL